MRRPPPLAGLLLLALAAAARAQEIDYREGFEARDPFLPWASNGSYTVNYKGLSRERAAAGRSAFKLDITLGTATYAYFQIPLDPIPSGRGPLAFAGSLLVAEAGAGGTASLGTNVSLAPAPTSGVNVIGRLGALAPPAWSRQTSDLAAAAAAKAGLLAPHRAGAGDAGFWTDRIGLYLYGAPGERIVVHVDDLSIRGEAPAAAEYKARAERAWAAHLAGLEKAAAAAARELDGLDAAPGGELAAAAKRAYTEARNYLRQKGEASLELLRELGGHLELAEAIRRDDADPARLLAFPWPASEPFPALARPAQAAGLSVRAARGQLEAASVGLRATRRALKGVTVRAGDLAAAAGGAAIPAASIDIRLVKRWFQAGQGDVYLKPEKRLVSELLLKDGGLVRVDAEAQANALRARLPDGRTAYFDTRAGSGGLPDGAWVGDAPEPAPFDLAPHENQQVWLTIRVPGGAAPGLYKGVLDIRADGGEAAEVPLALEVLPFELSPPRLEYAIYYTATLSKDGRPGFGAAKSEAQVAAELADLRDHGVRYPALYEPPGPGLARLLRLVKAAGLPADRLYLTITGLRQPSTPAQAEAAKADAAAALALAAAEGFSGVHFHGFDEEPPAVFARRRPYFDLIHQAGGKIFAAVGGVGHPPPEVAAACGILDVAILADGRAGPAEIESWRCGGRARVFSYANPQAGVEDPGVYRKNFGLGLFAAGYDGAMDFAYQYPFGSPWDDADDPAGKFRDHMFTYPASDSVIGTVQWEGFRAGVDDARYLATLLDADPGRTEADLRAEVGTRLAAGESPAAIRERLIDEILAARARKAAGHGATRDDKQATEGGSDETD